MCSYRYLLWTIKRHFKIRLFHLKALEMRMRKLVLDLSLAQILSKTSPYSFLRNRHLEHFSSKSTEITIFKEIQTLIMDCKMDQFWLWRCQKKRINGAKTFYNRFIKIIGFQGNVGRWKSGYYIVMMYFGFIILTRSVTYIFFFSTVDRDNDAWSKNCAERFSGDFFLFTIEHG